MPITEQATYSEPKITRDDTSAVIEFYVSYDQFPDSFEAIHINVEGSELLVSDRQLAAGVTSILDVPAPVLPAFIGELQRLAAVIS